MVYSEYFDRGTEPTSYCEMHETRGIVGKLAGMFGAHEKPIPPRIENTGTTTTDTGTSTATPAVVVATGGEVERIEGPPPTPKKKRGFWSKVFGRGKDDRQEEGRSVVAPKKEGRQ
jgi:hypothetical protein